MHSFDKSDYKGLYQNWDFAEDCKGNLYVANTAGVFIYNGFAWKQVVLNYGHIPRALHLGKDCKIYVGGYETIGVIDPSADTLTVVALENSQIEDSEEEIWHVFEDRSAIYFQSFSLLYKYDYEIIEKITPPNNIMFGQYLDDKIFIPEIRGGLFEFDDQTFTKLSEKGLPPEVKIVGVEILDGELIIATEFHGIAWYNKDHFEFINSSFTRQIKDEQINKMIKLQDGRIAIGTIRNGIYITDDFIDFDFHINRENGLSNNTVLSLYQTQFGPLCVGLERGFEIIDIHKPGIHYYDSKGQLGTIFSTIWHNDQFYLGSNQGLYLKNSLGEFELVPGSQGQVLTLLSYQNELIIGHNRGTLVLDAKQELVHVSERTGGLHMQVVGRDSILQSTYTGIILLEKIKGSWQEVHVVEGSDQLIEHFLYSNGSLAGIQKYKGLLHYKLDKNFTKVEEAQYYLPQTSIKREGLVDIFTKENGFNIVYDTLLYCVSATEIFPYSFEDKQSRIESESDLNQVYSLFSKIYNSLEYGQLLNQNPLSDELVIQLEEGYMKIAMAEYIELEENRDIVVEAVSVQDIGHVDIESDGQVYNANNNDLQIQLALNRNLFISKTHLKFKVSGFIEDWQDIPENGLVLLTKLPAGKYDFIVDNGEQIQSLYKFEIKPPWYRSTLGFLLYFILGFTVFIAINGYYRRKWKREKMKMEHEKKEFIEKEAMRLKAKNLEHEVNFKTKMLANSAMALVQKNKALDELKDLVKNEFKTNDHTQKQNLYNKIVKIVDTNLSSKKDWEVFETNFAQVHKDFIQRMKESYPDITQGDLKLAAYIRMDMSSKEIAPLLGISVRSVENKRYRLRKKMNLTIDDNLSEFLMRF
ncbi:hypothetical protein GCM10025777_21580 [Membranihabitans marinus]